MKQVSSLVLFIMLLAMPGTATRAADAPIDWQRARQLYQRSQHGEKLTPEEQAYLDRAKAQRRNNQRPSASTTTQSTGLTPLTDFKPNQTYKNQPGGLYGDNHNTPPSTHLKAAQAQTRAIVPLNADGKPAPDGKIVLLSIGMSNTTQEFSRFKQIADADKDKSPNVAIVDGAQGGQDAAEWTNPSRNEKIWTTVDRRCDSAHITPQQIQVVWIKQALKGPASIGQFSLHTNKLAADLISILHLAKQHYPNLRIAYLSSRIYAGYAVTPLNPEPYAYESAFAVRAVIQKQIDQDPDLNFDPAHGDIKSPLVLWGPYLWADGANPRSDGLTWLPANFREDGTHPSDSGRQKVADLLLSFFKTDPLAKTWFTCAYDVTSDNCAGPTPAATTRTR
jgi:lysophospholipase L1-like esterase